MIAKRQGPSQTKEDQGIPNISLLQRTHAGLSSQEQIDAKKMTNVRALLAMREGGHINTLHNKTRLPIPFSTSWVSLSFSASHRIQN